MRVSNNVARLLETLSSVTPTYVVGGTMRALFTGEPVKDLDLVVEDFDKAVEALRESGFHVSDEAKSFRVVKVFVDGDVVDVAGFRTETYDMVSRKPVVAPAKSIDEDVSRRDFTMNAIYGKVVNVHGDNVELEVVDKFGGLRDIEGRVVRAVGDPRLRFMEDPLRMLRALRFAVKLGYSIDPDTYNAIKELHGELKRISKERIRDELVKMLLADPARAVMLIYDSGVWHEVMPFLGAMAEIRHDHRGHHHGETVLEHTVETLENLKKLYKLNELNTLAVLLHDIGKPYTRSEADGKVMFLGHEDVSAEMAKKWLRTMRFPNKTIDLITKAISMHMKVHELAKTMSRRAIARFLVEADEDRNAIELALEIAEADVGKRYDELREVIDEMLSIPKLITGYDLLNYPAENRGKMLKFVREIQLAQRITDREKLLKMLKGLSLPAQKEEKQKQKIRA
jgi:putative nucleotidyltransferase with HDIG domain